MLMEPQQAHGMLPHLGSGAAQGIEDGYLLAQLLSHLQATKSNVEVRPFYFLVSTS